MSAITYTLGKGYNGRDAKGCRNCPHRVGSHRTFNLWNCVAPGRVCCPVLVPSGYCRISHPSDRRPVILASAHNGWCPPSARLKSGATQMSEIAWFQQLQSSPMGKRSISGLKIEDLT